MLLNIVKKINNIPVNARNILIQIRKHKMQYLFAAPYMIIFFTFTMLPVITSIFFSFTYFNLLEYPKFIGMENYIRLFLEDDIFLQSISNTLIFAAITGPLGYFLSLMFAWLINELPNKIRAIVTLVFYAPAISGNAFLIWTIMFSGDSYGYINGFLLKYGFISQPILWLTNVQYMRSLVIVVILWVSLGAGFLAFIAGLQSIDRMYYEAAAVEGIKNRWQELWYVTLPSIKPQLMFGAILSITASFGVGGVITGLVGFPSTDYAVHTMVHHLEDYGGIRFEMGYASAIATILFIMMIGTNKVVKKLISRVGV